MTEQAKEPTVSNPVEDVVILPCPFCGGDGFVTKVTGEWSVNCSECNGSTDQISGYKYTEKEAVKMWNKREI